MPKVTVQNAHPRPGAPGGQGIPRPPSRPVAPRVATSTEPDPWGAAEAIRMLVYGSSGSGKTTFAATFPDPILWLICSGGNRPGELKSIDTPANRQRIKPVIINSLDQFKTEIDAASSYATVVLDHASGFSDLLIKELLGLDEIPLTKARKAGKGESWSLVSQQQYGQLSVMIKEVFRAMLNQPNHVVVLAQERTFGGKEDGLDPELIKPVVGAALTPSVTGWLNPACDYVVQVFKRPRMERISTVVAGQTLETLQRGKGVEFCMRVGPHETFMTKFRVAGGLPDDLEVVVNPTYNKVLQVIEGKVPSAARE